MTVAEWRTVTYNGGITSSTFSVIGFPFVFMWASPYGGPESFLRCFPGVVEEHQSRVRCDQHLYPEDVDDAYYDLAFKRVDEHDEVFEDGWYLSGVGHHLLWCGAVLEKAVDEAQEHIAWDGSDPLSLPVRIPTHSDGTVSHRIPFLDPSVWEDDSMWFGAYTRKPIRGTERDPKR